MGIEKLYLRMVRLNRNLSPFTASQPFRYGIIRSTPTRVGKTPNQFLPTCVTTVHPHACGENEPVPPQLHSGVGPPPRVWGKRAENHAHALAARSTPTRVGKTNRFPRNSTQASVHPHACGENSAASASSPWAAGPPPRVWGKPIPRLRSIPYKKVHPHACGENGVATLVRA